MWRSVRDMLWQAGGQVGRYAVFLQGLMPLLGRWLVFAICLPITARGWQALRRRDWHNVIVALVILLLFAMLFGIMVALFWEVLRYKWGL